MELPIPAWFKYRQGEAKPEGERCYRLTAPQIEPAYIRVKQVETGWQASVADSADGPDLLVGRNDDPHEVEAWRTAFDLYRVAKIN